ncbi:HAD family hydrolase [Acholeplasma hippikon]|uniref:COF family HAD hydrolase protein n=1 Tax=Acholeplasma hippikon TaxID=264636 RepID=A0A449BJH6_9MOLU|nr:HAD family hydrolase [Acholeplasma hippikon]VEU82602.1 COF family HAD hydrolase protein [Acholeplasma hippikon]
MKKVLFSDYDGTFYRNELELRQNIEHVNKMRENGNLFVITTGRSFQSFKNVQAKNYAPFDYLILCGGALILDKDLNILKKSLMTSFQITSIINELTKFRAFYQDLTFVTLETRELMYESSQEITKITMNCQDREKAYEISEALQNLLIGINVYVIDIGKGYLVEMVDHRINKSKAISHLIEMKNLNEYEVITVGDSANDLEMIRDFNGYIMDNAVSELKTYSNKVVKDIHHLLTTEDLI